MLLRVHHRTDYAYPSPVVDSHNEVRLMPLTDSLQACRSFSLKVEPEASVHHYVTPNGTVHHFHILDSHARLSVSADSVDETYLKNPFERLNLALDDQEYYQYAGVREQYAEYLAPTQYIPLAAQAREIAREVMKNTGKATAAFLIGLSTWINDNFDYDPDVTHVHSRLDDVLQLQAGVCQDFAHLMLACCRTVGIPARYVSGYLFVDVEDSLRGNHATHAWIEALLPDGRWLGLDPTNRLLASDHYVRIHIGRDYGDVSPTRGVYKGLPAEDLAVQVSVDRVEDALTS